MTTGHRMRRGSVGDLDRAARPVLLGAAVLEVTSSLVLAVQVADTSSLQALALFQGVTLLVAVAALLWERYALGMSLVIGLNLLAFLVTPLGDEFLVWALIGLLAGLRGSRRAKVGVLALGLLVAVVLGVRAQTLRSGEGVPAFLFLLGVVGAGLLLGTLVQAQVSRIAAMRRRALDVRRETERVRSAERLRLADELQQLLTSGLGGISTIVIGHGGEDANDLRATLDEADASARSLLAQTRQLLVALRDPVSEEGPGGGEGSLVQRRRVRPAVAALLVAAGLVGVVLGGGTVAAWVFFTSMVTLGLLVWRRRAGIAAGVGTLVLVAVLSTLGAGVGDSSVLVVAALWYVAAQNHPRLAPFYIALLVGIVLYFAVVPTGADSGANLSILYAYLGLGASLLGAARRVLRLDEEAALMEVAESRSQQEKAAEEERKRVARELHDVVAYQLSTMTMTIMATTGSQDREVLAGAVERIADSVRAAHWELDSLLAGLRSPEAPEALVAPSAMASRLEEELEAAGFEPVFSLDAAADALEPAQLRTVVRTMQEGASNILRYAAPGTRCTFEVAVTSESSVVSVRSVRHDDAGPHPLSNGFGLRGIRERVELLGGSFRSGPERDLWHLWVNLPTSAVVAERDEVRQEAHAA